MARSLFLLIVLFASLGARAEPLVLTSIRPLQLIAAAMQEGVGQPAVLLPPGASAHHYSLRPSDVRQLREAALFYWVGPDLEAFLTQPLAGRSGPSLAVQSLPGLTLRHFGDEDGHEHHDEHGHDHDHRPGSLDAHLWLAPHNARLIAARMAEDLAHLDPAHAARYAANRDAFAARLDALEVRLKTRLGQLAARPYFVFHDAYGYFEAAFGLQHAGVFSLSGEVQPGARQVAAMRVELERVAPACVFSEPPLRPRLAETLSAGLPVRLAELDALGSRAASYEALLDELAEGLAGCLEAL